MTSRLHRVRLAAERIERAHADRERVIGLIRRYEVGLLIEEAVSADERFDVSREVHAGSPEAAARMLELVADAAARWEAGERPGRGDRGLIEEERRVSRKRLVALRHSDRAEDGTWSG